MSDTVIVLNDEAKKRFEEIKKQAEEETKRNAEVKQSELLGNLLKLQTDGKCPKANLFAMTLMENLTSRFLEQNGTVWLTVGCLWAILNQEKVSEVRRMTYGEMEDAIWKFSAELNNADVEKYTKMVNEATAKNSTPPVEEKKARPLGKKSAAKNS